MSIKKTFFYTQLQLWLKIASGLIVNKIIAVYLGPSVFMLFGQFQSFVTIACSFANASTQTGLVKYTSEYNAINRSSLEHFIKNVLFLNIVCSLMCTIFICMFAPNLSHYFMYSTEYAYIFYVFGGSIVFYSLNIYILSILNGLEEIGLYTLINILISVIGLLLSSILTVFWGLSGSLLSVVFIQSIVFFVTFIFTVKKYKFVYNCRCIFRDIDFSMLRKLLSYGGITFISGIVSAASTMFVRQAVQDNLSFDLAGVWEGVYRISVYYNMIFSIPFTLYYLPKFSHLNIKADIHKTLVKACLFFIPLMLVAVVCLYLFRTWIVSLLFSDSFMQMTPLFIWIGVGSTFNCLSAMLITIMLAKNNLCLCVVSTLTSNFVFTLLCILIMKFHGFIGLGYGFFIATIISFFINLALYKYAVTNVTCVSGRS